MAEHYKYSQSGTRHGYFKDDTASARTEWRQAADQLGPESGKLAKMMAHMNADVLTYMGFPQSHRAKLASPNPIGWLNGEVKLRTDVVAISPN